MKRVLMITSDYHPAYGGIGIHVDHLITYLNRQGIDVTVLVARLKVSDSYTSGNEGYRITEEKEHLKVVEIHTDFSKVLSKEENEILQQVEEKDSFDYYCGVLNQVFVKAAGAYLKEEKETFDLIHLHDAFVSYGAVLIGKYLKIPVVATMHSMNSDEEWLIDNVRRYLVNNVEKVMCVSRYIQNEIMERFQFHKSDKILTMYNSVKIAEEERNSAKIEKGRIVFCGRLEAVKGVDLLLEAVEKLPLRYRENLQVFIIGSGSCQEKLSAICSEKKLDKYVTFTGQIDQKEVFAYFDTARCVVLPSRKEPFATSALEAMARGCCVLASATGGFTELISDHENGLLFESENAADLEKKLEEVFDHEVTVWEMGKRAREKVVREYSWDATARKIAAVYEEVLAERR